MSLKRFCVRLGGLSVTDENSQPQKFLHKNLNYPWILNVLWAQNTISKFQFVVWWSQGNSWYLVQDLFFARIHPKQSQKSLSWCSYRCTALRAANSDNSRVRISGPTEMIKWLMTERILLWLSSMWQSCFLFSRCWASYDFGLWRPAYLKASTDIYSENQPLRKVKWRFLLVRRLWKVVIAVLLICTFTSHFSIVPRL